MVLTTSSWERLVKEVNKSENNYEPQTGVEPMTGDLEGHGACDSP